MTDNNEQKLESKIMGEIKSGQVKPRSRYVFLAEKLGLGSAFVLSIVLAILFSNLFFFYLKTADNLEYLSFGRDGLLAFLESFPYLLIISFILFLFLAGYLIAKSDISYKKPFKYLAIGLIFLVTISGGALAFTDISERMEKEAYSSRPAGMFLKPFFKKGLGARGQGITGVISEINDNYLIVQTPRGLRNINLEKLDIESQPQFEEGQFVIAVGEKRENDFLARQIRVAGQGKMPMIRRGIHHRFNRTNCNHERFAPLLK